MYSSKDEYLHIYMYTLFKSILSYVIFLSKYHAITNLLKMCVPVILDTSFEIYIEKDLQNGTGYQKKEKRKS